MARDDGDGWGEEGGMKLTPEVIGKHVRLKSGQGVEYAEGRVVAYSLEPMLMIDTPQGQVWWNASLAELGEVEKEGSHCGCPWCSGETTATGQCGCAFCKHERENEEMGL